MTALLRAWLGLLLTLVLLGGPLAELRPMGTCCGEDVCIHGCPLPGTDGSSDHAHHGMGGASGHGGQGGHGSAAESHHDSEDPHGHGGHAAPAEGGVQEARQAQGPGTTLQAPAAITAPSRCRTLCPLPPGIAKLGKRPHLDARELHPPVLTAALPLSRERLPAAGPLLSLVSPRGPPESFSIPL